MPYYRAVPEGLYRVPEGGFGANVQAANLNIGGGGLTDSQKAQACGMAKAWLAQHPVAASLLASEACGVCPTCPAPEECPTPESQGYILPEGCPTVDCTACPCPAPISCEAQGYVAKTEEEGGLAWWWLVVAAAGGAALGYALGSKKKALG